MANITNSAAVEKIDLEQSAQIIELFKNVQIVKNDLIVPKLQTLSFPRDGELSIKDLCFYKVSQLTFDEEYPRREAFENVLQSMTNQAFNFVYVITGSASGVEIDLGVVKNGNKSEMVLNEKISAADYGEIAANVFKGNFNGSELKRLKVGDLNKLSKNGVDSYKNAGVIIGIPTINEKENGENYDFQGIDRLVNSMLGLDWRLVIVCEPVSKNKILEIKEKIYNLYNRLFVFSKRTLQISKNDGESISFGKNQSTSKDKNWGYSKTQGTSSGSQFLCSSSGEHTDETNSEGESRGSSKGSNVGFNKNFGTSNSVTIEIANKHAAELMKYIDENLLERLNTGYTKGMFKTSIYYMAKEPTYANRLKLAIMSLFQGDKSSYSPMYSQTLNLEEDNNINVGRLYNQIEQMNK